MRKKRKIKGSIKLIFFIIFLFITCGYLKNNFKLDEKNFIYKSKNISTDKDKVIEDLYEYSKKDKRILTIINNREKYPMELLEMLSKNMDMTDYVLHYPDKKGNIYADNIGNVKKGEYPLLFQYDERWGYGMYGDNVLAVTGCGPTVLSMVIAGLTGRDDITPFNIAEYAEKSGYYQKDSGTSWSIMTEGIKKYGISGTVIPLSKYKMLEELEKGHPIVCSMRKGDFTTTGHFILIVGIKNGKFMIHDPNSKERSQKLWDYETLEYQIKNLWSFEKISF